MISWFTRNGIAANFLMVGIFLAGLYAAFFMQTARAQGTKIVAAVAPPELLYVGALHQLVHIYFSRHLMLRPA